MLVLLATLNLQGQTNVCAPLASGLIGWWSGETNAADFTGNHSGTTPFGIAYQSGVVGEAFDFDGSHRRVSIADSPAFQLTNAMTLEGWVYPRAYGGFITFRGDNRPGLDNWTIDTYDSGFVKFSLVDTDNNAAVIRAPLALNEWQHIAATWDRTSGDLKLYLNGDLAAQTNSPLVPIGVLDPAYEPAVGIGNHGGTFHQFPFNGLIDEMGIYNQALSAAQIAAIASAGSAGKCPSTNPPLVTCVNPPTGLVSWWRGDGTAMDVTGNYNGIITTQFNGSVSFSPGKVGTAFDFTGSDFVELQPLALTNFTIECWLNQRTRVPVTPNSSWGCFIISDEVCGVTDDWHLGLLNGGQLLFHIGDRNGGVDYQFPSASIIPLNTYVHVAVTRSTGSGKIELYINGVLDSTFTAPHNRVVGMANPDCDIYPNTIGIGNIRRHAAMGISNNFDGLIDEPAIYNRALSGAEIAAIYHADSAGKCLPTNPPPLLSAAPIITNFTPAGATPGSVVIITGTNFSPSASNNIVYFGATRAAVSGASFTNLIVTVPPGATHEPISVTVNGLTALAPAAFLPSFAGDGSNISPTSFAPGQNLTVGDGPLKTIIADLDGDGKPDLVEANAYAHNISLFRNIAAPGTLNGSSFAPRVDFPVLGGTDSPRCIAVADVDGDGKLDILAGDQASSSVLVYRNLATPGALYTSSFAAPVSFAAGSYPHGLRVADLNGDGLPEILVANYSGNSISILKNQGSAGSLTTNSFAPQFVLATGPNPTDVAVADFNGDGRPDLVTTAFGGTQLSVFRNVAGAGMAVSSWFTLDTTLPALPGSLEFAVADMDGDAKSDLIVASVHGNAVSVYRNLADAGAFHAGSFAARVDFGTPGWAHNVNVADFNGDGKPDLTVTGELGSYMAVFQNQSMPGSFTASSLAARVDYATGWNAWGVAAGDLDGDDRADIVFANTYDDTLTFYRNQMAFGQTNPPISCVNPPSGLVSWWKAENDAMDLINGHNGTLQNGVTFTPGEVGQGFGFNGTDSYVNIPSSAALKPTGSFAFEAWIKYSGNPGAVSSYCIAAKGIDAEAAMDWALTVSANNRLRPHINVNGSWHYFDCDTSLSAGTWYHVAMIYDGEHLQGYVNGALDGSANVTGSVQTSDAPLRLGAYAPVNGTGSKAFFTGSIDEASFYNRNLSAGELFAIFKAGSAGKCSPTNSTFNPADGLIAHYPFSGNAADVSGNGNHGTPSNAVLAADRFGSPNAAYSFNGQNTAVLVADNPALRTLSSNYTFNAWVRFGSNPQIDAAILMKSAGAGDQRKWTFWRHVQAPPYGIGLLLNRVPGGQFQWNSDSPFTIGPWYMVTFSASAGNCLIAVDGQVVSTQSGNLALPDTTGLTMSIGGAEPAGNQWFNGLLDDIRIYSRTFTSNDIAQLYELESEQPAEVAAIPVIFSFQPTVAHPGSLVSISGTNFSSITSNNIVYFGAMRALVVGGTTTNLQVIVPSGATYAPPTVTANGLTAAAAAAFTPTFAGAGNITVTNFAPRFNLPAGDGPIQTVIADLDGDGKPDLAVADNYAHAVSLYRNISQVGTLDANSFAARVVLPANPAGYSPYALVAADVDGDGWLDLVTADVEGNSVSVFRNQATGGVLDTNSFAAYVTFAVGAGPRTVAVADLDLDGRPEIVTANYGNSTISILRNASVAGQINASSFAARIDYPAGAGTFGVVAADLDGDGRRDIATANNQGASVSLFRNVGTGPLSSGSFVPAATLSVPAHAHFLYAADFDADGRLELVVNSYLGASMTVLRNQADPGVLDTNSFAAGITYSLSGRGHTAAFGDLNGDGKFDLIVDTEIADSIALFQNQHDAGGFTNDSLAARVDLVAGWNAWGNSVGDLDGDGRPDIVFANAYDDIISIYHNRSPQGTNPPTVVCVPPPVGLMGWWRAEGNTSDSFGTNAGTLLGGAGFAAGLVGQAFIFDGVDDSVRIPVSGPFTLPDVGIGEGFTVEAWINPNRLTIGPIFEWNNNAGGEGVHLWHSVDYITVGDGPGNLYGNIVDSSGTSHRITSPSGLLQTNQFNHVVLSYDRAAGMAVLYHNGVAVKSDILGTFTPQTSYDLYLGRRPSGPFAENLFAGLIDEPSIYNRALNAGEIAAIYAAGSAGKCYTNLPPPPEPPFITQQPQSITTNANANVRFSVSVTGYPVPNYQWFFNHAPLGGQVHAALVLNNVTPSQAGDYFVIANNASGSVTSSVATLTVLAYPPVITNQPKSIAGVIGSSASFSVGASGSAPLSYQWFFTGQPLPGRTQATLTLTNLQLTNAGNYFVRVSNPYGVTTSAVATLTVSPPPDCASPPSGIVAWWPGQSNLWDVIGVNDAQIYQSQIPVSQLYTTGKVGSALSFLGSFSKWIVAPPKPELNVGMGAGFTFETWLYRQSATSSGSLCGWGGFVSGYPSTPIGVRVVTTSAGAVQAFLARTNTSQFILLTTTNGILGVNTWRHVGLSCDIQSGLAVIYVDGIAVAQTNLPTQVAPLAFQTTGAFWLGSSPNNPQLVNAILDEPTLYNRALSQAEIQAIHDAQQTGKCTPAPACLNPLLDLAGWWRGESNALDSASINHGTTVPVTIPPAIAYTAGQFGAAFSLRQGNHVVISNPPSLNVGAGAGLTIETWINPITTSLPIVEWNSGTGTQGVYLAHSYSRGPGYLEANLVDVQGRSHVIQSPFISPVYNQWRHVAVTYDQASGAAALFVDGAVVTQTNLGSFTPRTTGNLYLGYRPPGNYPGSGLRFNGLMDEVAVYRRALTPAELRCAMRGGPNGKFPPANECLLPADGIVSWWRGESNQLDSIQSNHGLAGITAPFYTDGQVGLAFATGLRRYMQVPTPVGLDVGAGAGMTVEGWIKTTSAFGQVPESILGWRGNQFQGQGVTLEYSAAGPGSLRANLVTTNGLARYLVAPNGVIKTSQWQHVALTYDRASGWATLLVNGTAVAATNFGSFTPRTTGSFNLGWGGNFNYFTGAVDEFAVYNRALSPLEIGAIARAVKGRCYGEPPVIVQHPESIRVNPGSNVTFTVVASGSAPLRYQWGKGFFPPARELILPGQTNPVLSLMDVTAAHAGIYWVRVTNAFGVAVSTNIQLVVNSAPRARIVLAPLTTLLHETNLVIAPVCGAALVYFDGGQSSDADKDPLQFTWHQGTNMLGQSVLLTNTFAPGHYEIELEASDGSLSGFAQTTLRVISPAEAVQIIATAVSAADATADKRGNSLFASLRAAATSFERCQLIPGLNQLHAFQEQVRVQVAPNDPHLAAAWIAAAQQLIDGVTGPAPGRSGPKFQELTRTSPGKMKLRLQAGAPQPAWVQASTNLIDWETIGLAEMQPDGTATFEDPKAGEHARRFYRIVTP
jgi:hypothetical protein